MTEEELRNAIKVMQHSLNGGEVERCNKDPKGSWFLDQNPSFNFSKYDYRILPKYRPFLSARECVEEMKNHTPYNSLKEKNSGIYRLAIEISESGVVFLEIGDFKEVSFIDAFKLYEFPDGSKFGKRLDDRN